MKKRTTAKVSGKVARRSSRDGGGRLTSVTLEEALQMEDRTDWKRVDALTDERIEAVIASDPDAASAFESGFLARAAVLMPPVGPKKPIAFRVDPDVLAFFRKMGPGYQGRMNAVLRAYVQLAERP